MIDASALRNAIQSCLAESTTALSAATLGQFLRNEFPAGEIRQQFGGVKRFIIEHCKPSVEVLDASGNGLFRLAGSTVQGRAPREGWTAFTNPVRPEQVLVNTETGDLMTTTHPSPAAPWVVVPKLSEADYRTFAVDFLESLPEVARGPLRNALGDEGFHWTRWSAAVRSAEVNRFDEWMRFRAERIGQLFADRVRLLIGDEARVERARANLERSKTPQPARPGGYPLRDAPATGATALRTLVRRALEQLSDEELRRVWLPVGVLFDEVRNRRPSN